MSFTLELFSDQDIARVLADARRVLVPDGRLCVVAMAQTGASGLMSRAYAWAHARWPAYVDCRPIHVLRIVESAGFRPIASQSHRMAGLPVQIVLADHM
jgi:demethylmenaquinone methyltransferase/2-methoxy-6-polyprenyl-1,4-benzoquinol methylase